MRRCCRGRDGTAARRRAVLVRSAVPLGLDHFPLDAGGGKGPAGAHRLADHVAGLPEPGPARGQGPDRGIPGTDEQGVGPDPGRRGRRAAARPRHPRAALHRHRDPVPRAGPPGGSPVIPEALAEVGLPATWPAPRRAPNWTSSSRTRTTRPSMTWAWTSVPRSSASAATPSSARSSRPRPAARPPAALGRAGAGDRDGRLLRAQAEPGPQALIRLTRFWGRPVSSKLIVGGRRVTLGPPPLVLLRSRDIPVTAESPPATLARPFALVRAVPK